jgi:hypothetical protein
MPLRRNPFLASARSGTSRDTEKLTRVCYRMEEEEHEEVAVVDVVKFKVDFLGTWWWAGVFWCYVAYWIVNPCS